MIPLALAIQIAREAAKLVPEGVELVAAVKAVLAASSEPEAQSALGELKAAYARSSAEADEALRKRIEGG